MAGGGMVRSSLRAGQRFLEGRIRATAPISARGALSCFRALAQRGAAHGTFSSQLGQFTDAVASLNCAIVAVSPWTGLGRN